MLANFSTNHNVMQHVLQITLEKILQIYAKDVMQTVQNVMVVHLIAAQLAVRANF